MTLKTYIYIQLTLAIAVTIFGCAFCLRALLSGQIFCAICFFLLGYVCGYRLLLLPTLQQLRHLRKEP